MGMVTTARIILTFKAIIFVSVVIQVVVIATFYYVPIYESYAIDGAVEAIRSLVLLIGFIVFGRRLWRELQPLQDSTREAS